MESIQSRIPVTKIKILIAGLIYRILRPFLRSNFRVIRRGGIHFEVDLAEGIDLSLFLFGNFQKHVTDSKYLDSSGNFTIVDVGANFGVVTLRLAQKFPQSQIIAFEPTDYAFQKLKRNLARNPGLAARITAIQSFVFRESSHRHGLRAYSSWKVDGKGGDDRHPVHLGIDKTNPSIPAVSLDDFFAGHRVERIGLMKIDTDGSELDVLRGAQGLMQKFRPLIVFEVGGYLLAERGIDFSLFCDFFSAASYRMVNSQSGALIDAGNYPSAIPARSTIDIIAIPGERW